MARFVYTRRTHFAESDAAGVIHFSRMGCYVEEAEHAFLEERGFGIDLRDPAALRWPRVRFSAEYLGPVFPRERIEVVLETGEPGESSIRWRWSIRGATDGRRIAEGEMTTVCCAMEEGGRLLSRPLPEALRDVLDH